jgi:hypothetical protein
MLLEDMKRFASKRILMTMLFLVLAVGLAPSNIPAMTVASCADIEAATGNSFEAWSASLWTQTDQADFDAGVASQVDTTTSAGDVILAEEITEIVVASDDFESGDWAGGTGWLWGWWTENSPSVTTSGGPHGGSYHVQMASNGGYYYIARPTNMTGMTNARVQFWAKADSFGGSDYVDCNIYDGTSWNNVQTWVDGNDDNTYHYFDFDVSGMDMSSEFYVTFYAELSGSGANFYIDDVQFVAIPSTSAIATDDFESGDGSGGSGWLWDWYLGGDYSITTLGTPHGGGYHLRLRRASGYADRAVDLSGCSNVHLQFWAKANSFETGEYAICSVYDGIAWDVIKTWVDGDDDNIYHYFDIDISGYNMSSQFYIAFDAEMGQTDDYLYIDDIQFVEPTVYYSSGTLASQVLDTGASGTTWNMVFWDEALPSNTNITFEVRASDTLFAKDAVTPSWNAVGGTSPVMSGLPSGRYLQWRATLTTSDTANTPTLHEVRVYYY